MKKTLLTLIALCTTLLCAKANEMQGEGTLEKPFLIITKSQLETLSMEVAGGDNKTDVYYKLGNSIDLTGTARNQWTPIGILGFSEDLTDDSYSFKGNFDGSGFIISGIFIDSKINVQGFFGYIGEGGTVKNLEVRGKITGTDYVGGIVGKNEGGAITNCINHCAIIGSWNVGGIAGFSNDSIVSCANNGVINGNSYVGGIVGDLRDKGATINCYNTNTVAGTTFVGGIAGENINIVSGCYNNGKISGTSRIGGVAGSNKGTITNCYNASLISNGDYAGGLVAINIGTISNSYNTGRISAYATGGGVIGKNCGGKISNCYSLVDCVAKEATGDNGSVRSAAAMKSAAAISQLNLSQGDLPWKHDSKNINQGYPILSWQ